MSLHGKDLLWWKLKEAEMVIIHQYLIIEKKIFPGQIDGSYHKHFVSFFLVSLDCRKP